MHATRAAVAILTILVNHSIGLASQTTNDNVESPTAEQVEAWIADPSTLSTKLRAVKTLNVEAAKVLVKHKVARGDRFLPLDGLTSITPEVARILSFREGGEAVGLYLNGLKTTTPEVAEALASGERGGLSLGGLTTISVEVARGLSGVRRKLMLNGVTNLPVESARELAKHRSKLTLTGLPEISDEAAAALSVHHGTFLLNGLTRLTSPVLVQSLLKKSDGFVGFKRVETMTDEVAAIFVSYDGRRPLSLDGLTQLPPANAAALRRNEKIVLPAHLRKPGITNSLGMRLAYIPAGKSGMGSPRNEPKREAQERRHEVALTRDFYLGVHEVTVAQFRKFVRESGHKTEAEKDGKGSWGITPSGKFERDAKYNWKNPGFEQTDDHPVVDVSWHDAMAFCVWLSEKEEKTYRLPTEAEWEFACRAGTRTAYSFGDDPQDLLTAGNVADATARKAFKAWSLGIRGKDRYAYTAPVGQFKPNRFGLFDMHGNVWEWCGDWYDPAGYSGQRQTDPKGPASGERKVHRGGGWSSASNRCRSASRIGRHPSSYRGCYLGFRVVLMGQHNTKSSTSVNDDNPRIVKARDPKLNREFEYLVYDLGKDVELKLVKVEAKGKKFAIGSSKQEQNAVTQKYFDGKRPPRINFEDAQVVTMTDDYYLGRCEVTRGQFRRFVEDRGYKTETERTNGGYGWNKKLRKFEGRNNKYSWRNTGIPSQSDEYPVTNITRNDAREFCRWLREKVNGKVRLREVRLPGEAEWEFACRAGSRSRFSFGDDDERLARFANVSDASRKDEFPDAKALKGRDGFVFMAPVGQLKPNAFGLYDMHGNAWEWCEDYFGKYSALPKEGNGLQRSDQGERRPVMRGGAWYVGPDDCRCAKRWLVGIKGRYGSGGFRIVCLP